MTPEDWAWLESLPRVRLIDRIAYWDARHALEEQEPQSRRIRPYLTDGRWCGIMEVQPGEGESK